MTFRKLLFLFLALLLPVSIFIFLKLFGRNEFNVPVRHGEGAIAAPSHCPFEYNVPYTLPDSVFTTLNLNRNDSLFVFYFDEALNIPLRRISGEFSDAPVSLVNPVNMRLNDFGPLLKDCILLMQGDTSVALVDHKRRIRGYYVGADRDEVDRLMVEMKIILKQY